MIVETKNASLDTLAVTIQALHVSGKQMTLAVFRQLPEVRAYNDDGTLNSSLEHWGTVRYQVGKDGPVLWLVASQGGVLYRCPAIEGAGGVHLAIRRMQSLEHDFAKSPCEWRAYEAWRAYSENPNRYKEGVEPASYAKKPDLTTADWAGALKDARAALAVQLTYQESARHVLTLQQLFIAV